MGCFRPNFVLNTCRFPQLLSVRSRSHWWRHIQKTASSPAPHPLVLTLFHSFSAMTAELGKGWCPISAWALDWHSFSVLCPVMSLCTINSCYKGDFSDYGFPGPASDSPFPSLLQTQAQAVFLELLLQQACQFTAALAYGYKHKCILILHMNINKNICMLYLY